MLEFSIAKARWFARARRRQRGRRLPTNWPKRPVVVASCSRRGNGADAVPRAQSTRSARGQRGKPAGLSGAQVARDPHDRSQRRARSSAFGSLADQLLARDDQRAESVGRQRLHMHGLEEASAFGGSIHRAPILHAETHSCRASRTFFLVESRSPLSTARGANSADVLTLARVSHQGWPPSRLSQQRCGTDRRQSARPWRALGRSSPV
jgi:hypothetical protein